MLHAAVRLRVHIHAAVHIYATPVWVHAHARLRTQFCIRTTVLIRVPRCRLILPPHTAYGLFRLYLYRCHTLHTYRYGSATPRLHVYIHAFTHTRTRWCGYTFGSTVVTHRSLLRSARWLPAIAVYLTVTVVTHYRTDYYSSRLPLPLFAGCWFDLLLPYTLRGWFPVTYTFG